MAILMTTLLVGAGCVVIQPCAREDGLHGLWVARNLWVVAPVFDPSLRFPKAEASPHHLEPKGSEAP